MTLSLLNDINNVFKIHNEKSHEYLVCVTDQVTTTYLTCVGFARVKHQKLWDGHRSSGTGVADAGLQ